VKFHGPLDLTEGQGSYSVNVKEVRSSGEKQSRQPESEGAVRSTRDIGYRGFGELELQVIATRIAIS
jgi:hypothetical protein